MPRNTYNTPTPFSESTASKPDISGQKLLDKLENEYSNYRHDCNKGYCKFDLKIQADLKKRIEDAKTHIRTLGA